MNLPSNTKIENKAINALENVIDDHHYMDYQFNSMDKEIAWDGYIYLFNNNANGMSKKNFDDRLPVQIKGHIDIKVNYMNKARITYPVNIEDLRLYFHDRGVLYFQIFISSDGCKKEIFYSSLFPSKIKTYLEKAENKRNTETINIPFTKLDKNPEKLYIVSKQFSDESRTQGFGCGQLVQNTIPLNDLDKITSITATAIGANDEYSFLQRFSSGDISLYAKVEGNPFKIPLEWQDNTLMYVQNTVKNEISIDNKVYYKKYEAKIDSHNEITLILSENLQLNLTKWKFDFKPLSTIKKIKKDAEFLLSAISNTSFKVGTKTFEYHNPNASRGLKEILIKYIELDDTLTMIDFEYNKPYKELSDLMVNQLFEIVAVKNGLRNQFFKEEAQLLKWKIEDKYMPLLVIRHDYDDKNDLFNVIYSNTHQALASSDDGKQFIIPTFINIDNDILENLYPYNYNRLYEQIDNADINSYTSHILNNGVLKLIHAYDKSNNEHLIKLASYLLNKLEQIEENSPHYIINTLQIKKRIGTFEASDMNALNQISTEEIPVLCGISILLEDKNKADYYLKQMTKEEHSQFIIYPIYYLYQKLSK